jgi:hypothetical protein
MGVERSSTLYLKNSTTVDTGTGIDVRLLSATNGGTNDATQSVRWTHTQDNTRRTFDPATTLVATVADASTLQRKGWAPRLVEDMTPGDDTNCNVFLSAGTATVTVRARLNMNGGTNVGSLNTPITFGGSIWRYNPSTDAGVLLASGEAAAATNWNTTSTGDNNTYKTASFDIVIAASQSFASAEVMLLQIGALAGNLANPLSGTTNFDLDIEIDNATTRIDFASGQHLYQTCSITRFTTGEGLSSRSGIASDMSQSLIGEGLSSSTKASAIAKTADLIGEGLATRNALDIASMRDATGEGLTSSTRATVAAKTTDIVGDGLTSPGALATALPRDIVGEGLVSSAKATTAAKTTDLIGEGLVTETHPLIAARTFDIVGEGLVSRGALALARSTDVIGEGLVSSAKAVIAVKVLGVVGEGLATESMVIAVPRNAAGEGLVTETHPVQAYRTFDVPGEGLVVMTGAGASMICLPIDDLPDAGGGGTTYIRPIFVFDD